MNQSEPDRQTKHILLVEDTLTQAMYMQHILEQGGFKVTLARSGEKALTALGENKDIDLVLTDINMPGMDGYELVNEIKNTRPIPCILLLTAQLSEEVQKILASVADGLVFKSNNGDKFLAQVNLALIKLAEQGEGTVGKGQKERRLESFFTLAYQQIIDLL